MNPSPESSPGAEGLTDEAPMPLPAARLILKLDRALGRDEGHVLEDGDSEIIGAAYRVARAADRLLAPEDREFVPLGPTCLLVHRDRRDRS